MKSCALEFMIVTALVIGLIGCATEFTGSPYINGGADQCRSECEEQGLTMAGMVMMGEYTDGCICAVSGLEAQTIEAAPSAASSAVGVVLQQRRQQQAAQAQQ